MSAPGTPALQRTGLTTDRIQRIYRGIDPSRYHRDYRPCNGWLSNWQRDFPMLKRRRMVLLPGRLTRLKGHEDFPIVMERLCEQHPDTIGVVVGGEEARSRAYAASVRAAAPGIVFTGHRSDLREIMAMASAVVSLSNRPESFGRVVLEALSLGVPVVGYDHGGVGEVLEQVFGEGRVPVGRPDEAANRLASVLDDEAGARSRIRDHDFTLQRMCGETLALYEELAPGAWKR